MMLVGIGVVDIRKEHWDFKFTSFALSVKFLGWPLLMAIVIYIDKTFYGIFDPAARRAMFLVATTPLAANTVAFAAALRAEPEKSAFAVLLSTLLALIFIPLLLLLPLAEVSGCGKSTQTSSS